MEEIVIDQSNFGDYFFDVGKNGPKPNQVMARYITKAELVAGDEKGYLIDVLLTNPLGAEMGMQIVRNAFAAQELEGVKLLKAMATDLVNGMDKKQVLEKPYPYTLEKFYWTKEEYVPKNDPHWRIIQVTIINDPEKNKDI